MGRRNRNKILVAEARHGLDELKAQVAGTNKPEDAKIEVAKELGVPRSVFHGRGTTNQALFNTIRRNHLERMNHR